MKTGWKIIVGVVVFCFLLIIFMLTQKSEEPKRVVVEQPTAILSPDKLATYPKPEIYPGAQDIHTKLITRQGCIDNCDQFEPLKGLGGRITQFQTISSPEDVFDFYRGTLLRDGWEFDHEYSKIEHIYTFQKDDGPRFSLTISIDSIEGRSDVELYEEVSVPFTWPNP